MRQQAVPTHDEPIEWLRTLMERFLVDLARLGYREEVRLEYVDPELAEQLRRLCRAPSGWIVESDFGDVVEVDCRWGGGGGRTAVAELTIGDWSLIRGPGGLQQPLPQRWWRVSVTVDIGRERIVDARCAARAS